MGRRNLVDSAWLAERLGEPHLVVVDCRFDLLDPEAGARDYAAAHIPTAHYLDLERDLSGPKGSPGGRHPLPDMEVFSRKLGALGIDERVTVVAYDAQQGCMAARLWWMLRYLGHDRAAVLDGGWQAWLAHGYPTTAELPRAVPRRFVPRPRPEMAVGMEAVRELLDVGAVCLIDSRAPERYRGEVEPLDPVAGHIPGAVNMPWTDVVDEEGKLKPAPVLRERFAALGLDRRTPVVYCGSGVTACMNLLAMDEAGLGLPALYVGGWSDWCSHPANPVARSE